MSGWVRVVSGLLRFRGSGGIEGWVRVLAGQGYGYAVFVFGVVFLCGL